MFGRSKPFDRNIVEDLNVPTQLPKTKEEEQKWQSLNYGWWQNNPMSYDWEKDLPFKKFTREYYQEIDKRFFCAASDFLDGKKSIPFDEFIDFSSLKDKDVLEIGVGNGSHAQLLASHAKTFTGIDLTDHAIESTSKRMGVFGLKANIAKMDAESLKFDDNSFDFVWSWGVIHHSANTSHILKEIGRVLRPGGKAVIMVYYRGWWNYYLCGILRGILSGKLLKTGSLHKTVQSYTDGAIARYYTRDEWGSFCRTFLKVNYVSVYGPKADLLLLPAGSVKQAVQGIIPNKVNRFLTHHFKMGGFLVSELEKPLGQTQ
ncbi:MAG: class I SAM-dependent methyltransferase [Candidatus Saganbacteria bacterium]|nr:class I SAM-dependent methyltransferase [Candidatus Saganbacteria bacterium]